MFNTSTAIIQIAEASGKADATLLLEFFVLVLLDRHIL
jgi:hypothetical protein